jgi:hypothetical protein
MNKFKIVIFFSVVVIACQDVKNDNRNELITIKLKELTDTSVVTLSDLGFDNINYIPLETKEYSLIPDIREIKFDTGFFLIKYFNTILKFQTDGSFISKIGTEGRGPGEFLVAHDIDVDKRNHCIYLVDGWARKFYVYSENGTFIRTFKSPLNVTNFKVTAEGILCFSTNYIANIDTSYTLIDTTGKHVKSFPNRYQWNYKVQQGTFIYTENIFYWFNNLLFKKEVYSDTIFKFENKEFVPHLVIKHGARLLTLEARSNSSTEYLRENFISQKNLFEFGDYIYYEFAIDLGQYGFIASKTKDYKVLIKSDQGIYNDLDGGPNIIPGSVIDDGTVIAWINGLQLKNHINSEEFKNSIPKYPKKKKELEKLANSLKETDNPVLVLVK